jgi:hypothetical protein
MKRRLRLMVSVPRLLAAIALAAALVAIPALRPEDAGALYISERLASRLCYHLGGSVDYYFWTPDFSAFNMTCSLPGGDSFTCLNAVSSVGMVDCLE